MSTMSGKVLTTGGAGFIGAQGADITQTRRLRRYEPRTHLEEGLAKLARGLMGQIAIDRGIRRPWSSKNEG